ncbi:hypothetical protein [Nannocystis radixulma]|uniref:Uncharacterized protein n=1 Tax=Nannocystis radixulma TaxID=2995305 RepID=A0ABT5BKF2_9BACT|nr:hypothetical protein [Nannocystis radixulma]MDC0674629.1 hypothetical protein [Nannocystis radixulma]
MRFGFGARPAGAACFLSWLVTTGCSPGRSDASSRGTDSEGAAPSQASEGATTSAPGTSTGDAMTAATTTATTTATGEVAPEVATTPVEPCESHAAEADCDAAGCIWFATERVADRATCALESAGVCATASASTGDGDYDSAFYKKIGDVIHVRRVGRKASDFPGPEHPAGWTECGLGTDDPPECACVCAAGRCPGDVALALLDACASPRPCVDSPGDGDACLYQALAAAAAASLRVSTLTDDRNVDDRVFLRGDGTATWMRSTCDPRDHSCRDRKWELPRLCSLRDRAAFTACAQDASDPQCRDVAGWFVDCKLVPATCP